MYHIVNRLHGNPKYEFKLSSDEQITPAQYSAECVISTEGRGTTAIQIISTNNRGDKTWRLYLFTSRLAQMIQQELP